MDLFILGLGVLVGIVGLSILPKAVSDRLMDFIAIFMARWKYFKPFVWRLKKEKEKEVKR